MGKNYNPATIKRRIKSKANTAKIISKIVHNAERGKRRQARQKMKSKQVKDVVNSVQLDVIDDFEVWFTFLFKLFKQSEKTLHITTLHLIK